MQSSIRRPGGRKPHPDERSDIRDPVCDPTYRCAHADYLLRASKGDHMTIQLAQGPLARPCRRGNRGRAARRDLAPVSPHSARYNPSTRLLDRGPRGRPRLDRGFQRCLPPPKRPAPACGVRVVRCPAAKGVRPAGRTRARLDRLLFVDAERVDHRPLPAATDAGNRPLIHDTHPKNLRGLGNPCGYGPAGDIRTCIGI